MPRISTSSARPVAAIGLVPSMTAPSTHPAEAFVALVAGLTTGAALPRIHLPRAAATGLALLVLILGIASAHTAIGAITDARLTFDDPERAASFHAALNVFGQPSGAALPG